MTALQPAARVTWFFAGALVIGLPLWWWGQWVGERDAILAGTHTAAAARARVDAYHAGWREGAGRVACLGGFRVDRATGAPLQAPTGDSHANR